MSPDPTALFTPIRPGVLATEVTAQIRARILDGSLRPGDQVKDSVMAGVLGISRSPVREALRVLEERGLLRKLPNRSYEVISFTPEDVVELGLLRIAYETIAARWVVEHRPSVARLHRLVDSMEPADDSTAEQTRVLLADGQFHTALIELTGMRRLISGYRAINDQIALMLASGELTRDKVMIQTQRLRHQELLEVLERAIQSGDDAELVAEVDYHIRGGLGLLPHQTAASSVPA